MQLATYIVFLALAASSFAVVASAHPPVVVDRTVAGVHIAVWKTGEEEIRFCPSPVCASGVSVWQEAGASVSTCGTVCFGVDGVIRGCAPACPFPFPGPPPIVYVSVNGIWAGAGPCGAATWGTGPIETCEIGSRPRVRDLVLP